VDTRIAQREGRRGGQGIIRGREEVGYTSGASRRAPVPKKKRLKHEKEIGEEGDPPPPRGTLRGREKLGL